MANDMAAVDTRLRYHRRKMTYSAQKIFCSIATVKFHLGETGKPVASATSKVMSSVAAQDHWAMLRFIRCPHEAE
jgi:hypothetical protein